MQDLLLNLLIHLYLAANSLAESVSSTFTISPESDRFQYLPCYRPRPVTILLTRAIATGLFALTFDPIQIFPPPNSSQSHSVNLYIRSYFSHAQNTPVNFHPTKNKIHAVYHQRSGSRIYSPSFTCLCPTGLLAVTQVHQAHSASVPLHLLFLVPRTLSLRYLHNCFLHLQVFISC